MNLNYKHLLVRQTGTGVGGAAGKNTGTYQHWNKEIQTQVKCK